MQSTSLGIKFATTEGKREGRNEVVKEKEEVRNST
jgi:hypothetical protein